MRKDGFYWVGDLVGGMMEWAVAEYVNKQWFITGIERPYEDKDFTIIDENQVIRR